MNLTKTVSCLLQCVFRTLLSTVWEKQPMISDKHSIWSTNTINVILNTKRDCIYAKIVTGMLQIDPCFKRQKRKPKMASILIFRDQWRSVTSFCTVEKENLFCDKTAILWLLQNVPTSWAAGPGWEWGWDALWWMWNGLDYFES